MATAMDRIFGRAPKQESVPVNQPAADPKTIVNQPAGTSANGPAAEVPPLDAFKDIWSTSTNAPQDDNSPLLSFDPAKVNEAVSKMDFLSGIPSDLMTKATSGDVTAFASVVNTAVQKALSASSQLTAQVVTSATDKQRERFDRQLPGKLREASINDVKSENPILNHAAAAPMLDSLKRQFMSKHPTATPREIHAMAEEMLTTFASSLVGNKEAADKPTTRDPSDFSNWG